MDREHMITALPSLDAESNRPESDFDTLLDQLREKPASHRRSIFSSIAPWEPWASSRRSNPHEDDARPLGIETGFLSPPTLRSESACATEFGGGRTRRPAPAPERHAHIGIVVGLGAEARIARRMGRVLIGNGTVIGAEQTADRLIGENVRMLLSFGLAGGLDPGLRPGALVVPREVHAEGERFSTDPDILDVLGGATVDLQLAHPEIARSIATKRRLWQQTGAAAIDMESGAVARVARRYGLPFAVLRVVCDPAEHSLPHAASVALDHAGAIRLPKVLASIAAAPWQIPALITLACDAAVALRALIRRVAELRERLAHV